jgi:hypothetical protein
LAADLALGLPSRRQRLSAKFATPAKAANPAIPPLPLPERLI